MKLTVLERIKLLDILPQQGGIADIRIVLSLRESLSFTEAEHQSFGLQVIQAGDRTQLKWADDAPEADIEVGKRASEIIRAKLRALDQSEGLTEEHVSLWDKFIES